ncbi:SixA phosphatase family protein [Leifsonia sp. A12D58]|uniref:SixA phosphatase family protein n=1 Tax=Leifsonia sp. A12D58 TaxID=3397674 RepID=UPI0039DFC1A7
MTEQRGNTAFRRLVIMRHAKSDWPPGVQDHDRPLNDRGRQEAPLAGAWLHENGCVPDLVVSSSAVRTRQTCELVCSELGDAAPAPQLDDALYAASAPRMLSIVNHVPDSVQTLLVIAHMPGVQELAMHLASSDSDPDAYQRAAEHVPTSALMVFEVDKPWGELDGYDAKLVNFVKPR